MALVVEDGTGLATAESYAAEAAGTTYLASHGEDVDWLTASTSSREQALRKAARYIDSEFGPRFKGRKGSSTQSLEWPRSGAYDGNDYLIGSDALPQRLVDATVILAERALTDVLQPDQTTPGAIKKTVVKVGPITDEVEYAGSQGQEVMYRLAESLLEELILSDSRLMRG